MTKKKFTKEQIRQLQVYWDRQEDVTKIYRENIYAIERIMEDALGIEGLEFF